MAKRVPRVAVVVPIRYGYSMEMLRGVTAYATAEGPWEFHGGGGSAPCCEPGDLGDWKGDGLIAQCTTPELAGELLSRGVPVVNVSNRVRDAGMPRVSPDDLEVGRMAARHFMEHGFVHLGFVGIGPWWLSDRRGEGFAQAVAEAGRSCQVFGEPGTEGPSEALAQWLAGLPKPVGVLACSDIRARHVLECCRRRALEVPEQVAVLGVDNDEWEIFKAPVPLSSIDLGARRIGYRAAQMLAELMAGRALEEEQVFMSPAAVMERRSTDVIAADDEVVQAAVKYIREHRGGPLDVERVLEVVGVSRRSLEMRFRKVLSRSPQMVIWQSHVERAKALLTQTELAMKQVAVRSGFCSPERFSVVFRRLTGQTPSDYRRLLRAR